MRSTRQPSIVLHKEGRWELLDAAKNRFNVGNPGRYWQSVIKHWCTPSMVEGSPYWMLLEYANTPTVCIYCKEPIPDSIVVMFKFMNWECIR